MQKSYKPLKRINTCMGSKYKVQIPGSQFLLPWFLSFTMGLSIKLFLIYTLTIYQVQGYRYTYLNIYKKFFSSNNYSHKRSPQNHLLKKIPTIPCKSSPCNSQPIGISLVFKRLEVYFSTACNTTVFQAFCSWLLRESEVGPVLKTWPKGHFSALIQKRVYLLLAQILTLRQITQLRMHMGLSSTRAIT